MEKDPFTIQNVFKKTMYVIGFSTVCVFGTYHGHKLHLNSLDDCVAHERIVKYLDTYEPWNIIFDSFRNVKKISYENYLRDNEDLCE